MLFGVKWATWLLKVSSETQNLEKGTFIQTQELPRQDNAPKLISTNKLNSLQSFQDK